VKAKKAISLVSALAAVGLLTGGCGGGGSNTVTVGAAPSTGENSSAANREVAGGASPSEAQAAATGDIPDNQVFLVFHDSQAGYSIRYPEGWARKGSASDVTFEEKANTVHVVVRNGAAQGKPGVKSTFTGRSAPDPVTGKRLPLTIDRYEFPKGGKVAVVDLVTPVGVDNVDAYRLISKSFLWLN